MDEILNGFVVFRADFKYSDSFDNGPGKELAELLVERLSAHDVEVKNTEEPFFAHYFEGEDSVPELRLKNFDSSAATH